MELSYKIIKKKNFNFSEDTVEINSDKTLYKKEVRDFENEISQSPHKQKPQVPSKDELMSDFLEDIERDRKRITEEILKEAKEKAKDLKDKAIEEGFMEGHSRGYRKGIEESIIEGKKIKEQAIAYLIQCEEEAEKYFEIKKDKIIQLAGDMARVIIKSELETKSEKVLDMVKPIIQDYKRGGMVIISCGSLHQKTLKDNIKILKEINPELEFIILKNPSLSENNITLEYRNQIIDLNIGSQIESMVKELQNLEV